MSEVPLYTEYSQANGGALPLAALARALLPLRRSRQSPVANP